MAKYRDKIALALVVIGAALVILTVLTCGTSAVFLRTVDCATLGDTGSGALYRPFYEVELLAVRFSGLYLVGENEQPAAWLMEGVDSTGIVCFFQTADGVDFDGDGVFDELDAPQDAWNVSYILRAPQPSYADHADSMLQQVVDDTAQYYGIDHSRAESSFVGVFEADRSGLVVARVGMVVGVGLLVAALVVYLTMLIGSRREDDESEVEAEIVIEEETSMAGGGDTEGIEAANDVEDVEDELPELSDEELDAEALAAGEAIETDEATEE